MTMSWDLTVRSRLCAVAIPSKCRQKGSFIRTVICFSHNMGTNPRTGTLRFDIVMNHSSPVFPLHKLARRKVTSSLNYKDDYTYHMDCAIHTTAASSRRPSQKRKRNFDDSSVKVGLAFSVRIVFGRCLPIMTGMMSFLTSVTRPKDRQALTEYGRSKYSLRHDASHVPHTTRWPPGVCLARPSRTRSQICPTYASRNDTKPAAIGTNYTQVRPGSSHYSPTTRYFGAVWPSSDSNSVLERIVYRAVRFQTRGLDQIPPISNGNIWNHICSW